MMQIRLANDADAAAIQTIYAPIVESTTISFETVVPTVADMQDRIITTLTRLPWLVAEKSGETIGYVYASQHRVRTAYQWSVDVSAYMHMDHRGQGIGSALYTALFQLLKAQGFYNAFAGITLPNPASIAIHTSLGFQLVGIYKSVGYKFGAWHDVSWYQLALQPLDSDPDESKPIDVIYGTPVWDAALAAGMSVWKAKSAG